MKVLQKRSIGSRSTRALISAFVLASALALVWPAFASPPLAAAARGDNLALTRQLIAAGTDVNLPEPDGTTALLWAVFNSSPELARLLLAAGADPNLPNSLDISPLLQASRYGDAGMISLLIAAGARITGTSATTEPPLLAAARAGNAAAVQVLLAAGADPNGVEPLDTQTALMWAAAENRVEIARLLLAAGTDPNRQARISELSERKNADFPSGGFAALHWAARNGDEAMLRLLIAHGADINTVNGDGATPLMLAIVNDRFDIAALLLDLGADPNAGALYYATEMRDATTDWRARDGTILRADHPNTLSALDLTRQLLEAGADPNLPFQGQMHNASMCCDTKANATPFYRAAVAADVEGLQLMLAYGADTEWRPLQEVQASATQAAHTVPGKTALMAAVTGGKGVGIAGGPNDLRQGPPAFREAANREPLAAVEVLLQAGADLSARDPDQNTALHLAAKALHPGIVRALVKQGAALDARNKDNLTPLQLVESLPPPLPRPGFYFEPPLAQPAEIAALLTQLAGEQQELSQ